MRQLLDDARRFLLGLIGREFFIFLLFVVIAAVFWMLTTLNESFEQELRVPVRFANVPENVVLTSGDEDTLRFTVRDKGFSLLTYLYTKERQPVVIDFARYAKADGSGIVPTADLLRMVNATLPASAKAVSVKPEQQKFFYNNGEHKQVPIRFRGQVEAQDHYYIDDIVFSPDSLVTIYATNERLDSIKEVFTEAVYMRDLKQDYTTTVKLRTIEGVKMKPKEVTLTFCTDMLTEYTINDIPVGIDNMPDGKEFRSLPGKVSVHFVVGMRHYSNISADDFRVVADYNELAYDTTGRCNIYLKQRPDIVRRPRLSTDKVEYIIEEHSTTQETADDSQ